MTQSILTDDGFETDSELKRLYRLRTAYYTELLSEMDLLRRKRVDLIKSFKIEVWDIDKQITRAKHREQHE